MTELGATTEQVLSSMIESGIIPLPFTTGVTKPSVTTEPSVTMTPLEDYTKPVLLVTESDVTNIMKILRNNSYKDCDLEQGGKEEIAHNQILLTSEELPYLEFQVEL